MIQASQRSSQLLSRSNPLSSDPPQISSRSVQFSATSPTTEPNHLLYTLHTSESTPQPWLAHQVTATQLCRAGRRASNARCTAPTRLRCLRRCTRQCGPFAFKRCGKCWKAGRLQPGCALAAGACLAPQRHTRRTLTPRQLTSLCCRHARAPVHTARLTTSKPCCNARPARRPPLPLQLCGSDCGVKRLVCSGGWRALRLRGSGATQPSVATPSRVPMPVLESWLRHGRHCARKLAGGAVQPRCVSGRGDGRLSLIQTPQRTPATQRLWQWTSSRASRAQRARTCRRRRPGRSWRHTTPMRRSARRWPA